MRNWDIKTSCLSKLFCIEYLRIGPNHNKEKCILNPPCNKELEVDYREGIEEEEIKDHLMVI